MLDKMLAQVLSFSVLAAHSKTCAAPCVSSVAELIHAIGLSDCNSSSSEYSFACEYVAQAARGHFTKSVELSFVNRAASDHINLCLHQDLHTGNYSDNLYAAAAPATASALRG